jgi:hypothetical protein
MPLECWTPKARINPYKYPVNTSLDQIISLPRTGLSGKLQRSTKDEEMQIFSLLLAGFVTSALAMPSIQQANDLNEINVKVNIPFCTYLIRPTYKDK